MKEKIERFIKETVNNEEQFNICHELYGHCLTEHILDLKQLQEKLWNMPKPTPQNPLIRATRFTSKKIALQSMSEALLENINGIIEWRKKLYLNDMVITKNFIEPIGDGIVKGADKYKPIPMHQLRIILQNGDYIGQPFYIKTAYPFTNLDDVDACYDAIDEWEEKKKRKGR